MNFAVGSKDIWNTSDVQLSVVASDNSNKVSVKYALNCSSNCQYTNVIDNKIKISTEGNNTVTVVATDSSNNSTEVKVPVKIDKTVPTITYSETINDVIYDNTGTKEICAICSDKLSGCKSEKSCIKTSASNDNVVLSVVDNAGNKVSSKAFKIVYDTTKPKCSLKVSSSGKVTATHSDAGGSDLAYYGFSSSYSGTNTSSKTYDSEGSKTYYVKDRAGNKNTCKISIKSRSVNCVCPSGYSVISSVSSTKCSKKQGAAGWGSWSVLGSPTKVDSCASLNTCNTSKTADCYKCIEDQADGRYVKTIYMRKRNVCPSGTTLYSAACYYVKSKTCEKEFYS